MQTFQIGQRIIRRADNTIERGDIVYRIYDIASGGMLMLERETPPPAGWSSYSRAGRWEYGSLRAA